MSAFDNAKNLQRWCAAVSSDYEVVISRFMIATDCRFSTFKKAAMKCGTILLHHCAVGKGKKMSEQHVFITKILLEAAKDLWLVAPMGHLIKSNKEPPDREAVSRVKQMIAGFYLTYLMYKTRIIYGPRLTMDLDAQDLYCFHYFRASLLNCDGVSDFVKQHIHYMLADLHVSRAFEIVTESRMLGIHPITRLYNNIMQSATSEMNKELKDWQCNSILPIGISDLTTQVAKLESEKMLVARKSLLAPSGLQRSNMLAIENSPDSITSSPNSSALMRNTDSPNQPSQLMNVIEALTICHLLYDVPVQTVPNMLANNIADRAMMFESRRKMERKTHKMLGCPNTGDTGEELPSLTIPKKSGPYIQDGGIFGRKRVREEEEETPRTEKKAPDCSNNLWSYINSGSFDSSTTGTHDA